VTTIKFKRACNGIYDAKTGALVYFFATERDAQMCMTLMAHAAAAAIDRFAEKLAEKMEKLGAEFPE
jgi:hypothetical protein